jgi:hypothetical protein
MGCADAEEESGDSRSVFNKNDSWQRIDIESGLLTKVPV